MTAYVPGQGGLADRGALGEPVLEGLTVAVSRDLKHLVGRWVYLDGYGWRYVNDLTAKRYTRRVDVAMYCRNEAVLHGKQKTIVRVKQ